MRKKIALVNQRYGLEVNGGSELHCRQLAEKLIDRYDVEVITTCAVDYTDWANYYPEGISEVNGITVRRFSVDKKRDVKAFSKISEQVMCGYISPEQYLNIIGESQINIKLEDNPILVFYTLK